MNLGKAYTYSHVEAYLPDELWLSDYHFSLWAYLNSSLVWLYREITGRRNLGGGLLKAEATDMKRLPVGFAFDFGRDARRAGDMHMREPLPVTKELQSKEHLFIDRIVFQYLGLEGMEDDGREALREMVGFRMKRARATPSRP